MSSENPKEIASAEPEPTPEQKRIAELEKENMTLRQRNEALTAENETLKGEKEAERKEKEELRNVATKDPLTLIFNRRGLKEAAALAFAQRNEGGPEKREKVKPITVLTVDIDNFKIINDAFGGHSEGDRILKEVADFLQGIIRQSDILARTGGEEFTIVFNNATEQDIYNKFFDPATGRSRLIFKTDLKGEGEKHPIELSGGITMLGPDESIENLDAVIDRADKALYRAKEDEKDENGQVVTRGRNRLLIYNDKMTDPAKE
jgi:diguanylate cyclase (GGDEF)-like protein